MKKNIISFSLFFLIIAFSFNLGLVAKAQVNTSNIFNPNNIISDYEMLNAKSLNVNQIQSFLQNQGSFLATYQTDNAYGSIKSAAEIIYDASNNNYNCDGVTLSDNPTEFERNLKCKRITTINPKVLLTLLQKEQSLIQKTNPSQKALDEATGYGCPTGSKTCSPYWKGFGKQVNSAALQFLHYMESPRSYNFKVGQTYIAKDKYTMLKSVDAAIADNSYNSIVQSPGFVNVTIENQATAALYIYTPHVYNGNYNFDQLYKKYFGSAGNNDNIPPKPNVLPKIYPDASILKLKDDPGIWLIEGGFKRPFANYSSFISRFSERQVIITSSDILDAYPKGEPIKFPDYSLVQTPDKKIYLLVGKEKRPFESLEIFKRIGFHESEIEPASYTELYGYVDGQAITANSTYVTGALLQDIKTGGVYYVENGTKAPLLDKVLLQTKYKGKDIMRVSAEILNKYLKIDPILLPDGSLLKSNASAAVYLVSDGVKRAFASGEIFSNLGYRFDNVITVSPQLLYQYPQGELIQ